MHVHEMKNSGSLCLSGLSACCFRFGHAYDKHLFHDLSMIISFFFSDLDEVTYSCCRICRRCTEISQKSGKQKRAQARNQTCRIQGQMAAVQKDRPDTGERAAGGFPSRRTEQKIGRISEKQGEMGCCEMWPTFPRPIYAEHKNPVRLLTNGLSRFYYWRNESPYVSVHEQAKTQQKGG